MSELSVLAAKIKDFRDARDWAQFHNPKDMALAISIEASELLELFLWKSPEEVDRCVVEKKEALSDEMADIAIYLVELADNLGIDLPAAMHAKIDKNAAKYPVELARGSSRKYTEYSAPSGKKS